MIDYRLAFEMLVDRLTGDELTCGINTPDNLTQLTDEQIFAIKEMAQSCINDATDGDETCASE